MNDIITFSGVSYHYTPDRAAVSDINFSVAAGDIFAIIGSNGCGKTTLLHLMCGLLFPTTGQVIYKDKPLTEAVLREKSFNQFFRSSVGYVFQNPDSQLFCPTVYDELIFGPLQMGKDKQTAMERAASVMTMLNIDGLSDRPAYTLSGGEKKRVAIGSVLTTNPDVLLIDEPMGALDPKTRSFLIELIIQLNEAGKTIVLTTHHLELIDHLQPRVAVLSENHQIEKIGSTEEILTDTDLLVRTNLISEHWHKHGKQVHKHLPSGFLFHKH